MLQVYNIPFEEKMLGVDFTREILLENYPSAKTFPVVVVDGFYIGGYEQLTEMVKTQIAATTQQRLLNEANNSGCSV
jgi:glutaredoxin-related protein